MTVLTPTLPVRFAIGRLRQSIAEVSRFSDQDLLGYINEGYKSAAVRAQAFRSAQTITVPAGSQETPLPSDHSQTLRVYVAGCRFRRVSSQRSQEKRSGYYYQYEDVIGFTGVAAVTDTDALLYYVQTPTPLGLDSIPLWGTEWNCLLRYYAAWRCLLVSGGAQLASQAQYERSQYELGIVALRRQSMMETSPQGQRIRVAQTSRISVAR